MFASGLSTIQLLRVDAFGSALANIEAKRGYGRKLLHDGPLVTVDGIFQPGYLVVLFLQTM